MFFLEFNNFYLYYESYVIKKYYLYLFWTILVNFSIFFINLMFLYIFKIIIKLIMTSSRFDPGST